MPKFEIFSKTVSLSDMYENHYDINRFRALCKECGNYNNVHTCPPYDFDDKEYLSNYKYIVLILFKIVFSEEERNKYIGEELITYSRKSILNAVKSLQTVTFELEERYPNSLSLGMGGCKICDKCNKPLGEECRFPDKLRYAPEALGFNMVSILESYFGIEMKWAKDMLPEYYTVLSGLWTVDKSEILVSEIESINEESRCE